MPGSVAFHLTGGSCRLVPELDPGLITNRLPLENHTQTDQMVGKRVCDLGLLYTAEVALGVGS